MNVYPFVEAEQAGQRNVGKACALLEVSRAAYYQWSRHAPSARARADEVLGQRIERIHHDSRGTYGAPRVLAQLRRDGVCVGTRRVARLMRQHGLSGRCRRRFQRTAIPDPQAGTAAVDLLQGHFAAAALELNQAWCGDISYVRTREGWLYLATVIDLASRRVVGWAMADHMRTTLVGDALRMAVASRRPPPGLIFHTDRGSQYTARDFTALLADHAIRQSALATAAVLGTTRSRRAGSRRSRTSSSTGAPGPPGPRRVGRFSSSSRSSTIADGCTRRSATSAPPSTKRRRMASRRPLRRLSQSVCQSGSRPRRDDSHLSWL